ncbi:DNA topoisomerase I [Candidatus Pacearchaeota archaeon]|nr:MAG: DNA topoisomerase I [Candidatus Pacearchaeota archaeon]
MAVQEFVPIHDAKLVVEKPVKPKPSVEELTKVEKPGKPVPATSLDEKEEKKRKKKRDKAEPSKIEKLEGYILIITEKPQAAQKIASALGKPTRKLADGVSFYEVERDGEKIVVCSAVGHLFNITYKAGERGWPIYEVHWTPAYTKSSSKFTKKYYNTIKRLSQHAKDIIIATDYDIEGEVIGWNILRLLCKRDNAKRMKYSTLTKKELEEAYKNPMEHLDWGQAYAGETRHILDWLYGVNLSRALMDALKKIGTFKILSIGRVQGPALKIIVDREREIEAFKPEPYWQVFAVVKGHEFKHPENIFDKNELAKFEGIKKALAETRESLENVPPPHPFDLTTLQREAYRVHKISPSQTLAIAQRLYLAGLISYPRTSSQKLPPSIEVRKILAALAKHYPEAKIATRQKPVEGKKSDPAHPAIYPTGEYAELSGNDKKIYELIVKRFIATLSPDAKLATRRVKLVAVDKPEIVFKDTGNKVIEKAWLSVYPTTIEEKEVPKLDGEVDVEEIKFVEKETQPPKRYTPASLVSTLEKKNLGTKATRSMIVDTLFDRGYLEGKSIKATKLGKRLIETLENYSPIIIDENLTRQLEEQMEKLQELYRKNSLDPRALEKEEQKIIERAKQIISDIAKEFKSKEIDIGKELLKGIEEMRNEERENNTLMECPTCKKGMLRITYSPKNKRYFVACSNYPDCTQTYSLPPNRLIKKAQTECEFCKFSKLLAITKGKRPWEFCFNPECPSRKRS